MPTTATEFSPLLTMKWNELSAGVSACTVTHGLRIRPAWAEQAQAQAQAQEQAQAHEQAQATEQSYERNMGAGEGGKC